VFDLTLKLGLTNSIDLELQSRHMSPWSPRAQLTRQVSPERGDTFARLKVNVLGDDDGDVAVALLPYVKLPTAQSGLGNGRVEGGLILPISINAPASSGTNRYLACRRRLPPMTTSVKSSTRMERSCFAFTSGVPMSTPP
jgi:hypothetical protein